MTVVFNSIKNKLNQYLNGSSLGSFFGVFALAALYFLTSIDAAHAQDINAIQTNAVTSAADLPGLVSAGAYLLGIIFGVFGIIKLKNHVENPQQNPLSQALIRLVVGGGLFALPIIYEAAYRTIAGAGGANTAGLQDTLDQVGTGGFNAPGGGGVEVNTLAQNVVDSTSFVPGFAIALAYLFAIVLAVTALLKFKESIDIGSGQATASQAAMRSGIVRLLVAGMLFAIPTILVALDTTVANGVTTLSFNNDNIIGGVSGLLGAAGALGITMDFNNILANIIDATNDVPGLISAVAYMLGVIIGIIGIIKIKEHVENPDQVTLKEPVIRLLVAGALLGLPAVYNAMFVSFGGGGLGILGMIAQLGTGLSFFFSSYAQAGCTPGAGTIGAFGIGSASAGELLCDVVLRTGFFPAFLTALSYVMGLVLGIWGIMKIRDHVLNPQQTKLWEGISRLAAGGLFFALPVVLVVAQNTIVPGALTTVATASAVSGYNSAINIAPDTCNGGLQGQGMGGLDAMLGCFMGDMMAPLQTVLNFFAYAAGIVFIMIGVSRLIKSSQDGARGPGGLGTLMTFAIGGALMSYNSILAGVSSSLFGVPQSQTNAQLSYTNGMAGPEVLAAHTVVSSIIQFMIVIGLYSFVRGLFIVRSVSEGNQQASIMAGMTHIIGGAVAVNLGPLINAVQQTLGIGQFGIVFS